MFEYHPYSNFYASWLKSFIIWCSVWIHLIQDMSSIILLQKLKNSIILGFFFIQVFLIMKSAYVLLQESFSMKKSKSLKPYLVSYRFNGEFMHNFVLAFSECHAVQVVIKFYVKEVVRSPDCLTDFSAEVISHLR